MAPSGSTRPNGSGRSDVLRVLRPAVVALAAVAIAFCGWSAWEYSQGNDPLAFLGGALQTVEEDAPAAVIELDPQGQDASQASEEPAENPDESQPDDAGADAGSASAGAAAPSSSDLASAPSGSAPSASASSGGAAGSASGSQSSPAPGAPSSGSAASPSRPARITVSITVDGSRAGAGSSSATLSLQSGSTVYDALAASGVSYNAKSTGYGMYVSSIAGLAEKDHGGMSGWLYSVNGVVPNYACSSYELSDGDSVYWWYDNVEY